jgi:hypothetical protein
MIYSFDSMIIPSFLLKSCALEVAKSKDAYRESLHTHVSLVTCYTIWTCDSYMILPLEQTKKCFIKKVDFRIHVWNPAKLYFTFFFHKRHLYFRKTKIMVKHSWNFSASWNIRNQNRSRSSVPVRKK